MKLRSFTELGAALPCPASPEASALVRGADELLAQLEALASAAREARTRAAGAVDTISTLEARAQAIEDRLVQVQGLEAFMGDEARVLHDLGAQTAQMRTMAQALRDDPAVRAYSELQAAEEAAREEAAAQVRARLNAMLRQAADVLAQGDHENAATLVGEIRAAAKSRGLAAEYEMKAAELTSIVAQARAEVKARQEVARERETRRAFGAWLRETVLPHADFAQGDVVITLGLGQARHLRPRVTRRGNVVWDELSSIGVEPKGILSTVSPRAKVWDWRKQAPGAARTLAEAERRARAIAAARSAAETRRQRPRMKKAAEATATYEVRSAAEAPAQAAEAPQDAGAIAESPAGAPQDADAVAETQDAGAADLDSAIAQALQEAAQAAPESEAAAVIAAALDETAAEPEAEGPHLVVFEAEDAMTAQYWASTVADILTGLGHEAIGARVAPQTPQVAAHGLVIDGDEALEVEVTVNGRILATPQGFASRSGVKTPVRRERNVAASLRRQLARVLVS